MTGDILNTLQELVVSICDDLYAKRQLITKNSVKKIVMLHGLWSDEELELEIPTYINDWRISNLTNDQNENAQFTGLQEELARARATIQQLNAEITSLRLTVVQNLRGLLNGSY